MEKLAREVRQVFAGPLDRRRRSPRRGARNLDFRRTLRANLGRWSPEERKLYVEKLWFFTRRRRFTEPWQIVLLVDQSGSMVGSVIHSAVTAACLSGLPGLRTHLVAFDTAVVDLTDHASDPVELLMKVQLGGGTDIGQAVEYAAGLLETPRRSIVVLVSDFFEGASPELLVRRVKALCEQGTKVLGLAALDEKANPIYDRELAARLVRAGAHVAAMTPGELAGWIAREGGGMRADLLALTPEALAALANVGLVKRAQKELEQGKGPELSEEADGLVTGVFPEGVTARLPPGVALREAPCSCGAPTVCRHRVAVALAYPAWVRKEGGADEPAPEAVAWSPGEIGDEALRERLGRRAFERAAALRRSGVTVAVRRPDRGDPAASAELPSCTVRFLVPGDLAWARCDCAAKQDCEHVAVAV